MIAEKVAKTEYLLTEANSLFERVGVLWSGGKDSTAMLYMIKDCFPTFPFKVIYLDNGQDFEETYEYMDRISKELCFEFIRQPIQIKHDEITGLKCCGHNKTEALKKVISDEKFDAIVVSIRRDEHAIRGAERYFSPRDNEFKWHRYNPNKGKDGETLQDTEFASWGISVNDFGPSCDHVRVHPILHWTEIDTWRYTKERNIPINSLYFSKNGKRFRSIGCTNCSVPISSNANNIDQIIEELEITHSKEREGRIQDKEVAMQRLRSLGYM